MLDQLVFNTIYAYCDYVDRSAFAVSKRIVQYMHEYRYTDMDITAMLTHYNKFMHECIRTHVTFRTNPQIYALSYNIRSFNNFSSMLTPEHKKALCTYCVFIICRGKRTVPGCTYILETDETVRKYLLDNDIIHIVQYSSELSQIIKRIGYKVTHSDIKKVHEHGNDKYLPGILDAPLDSADVDAMVAYVADDNTTNATTLFSHMLKVPSFVNKLYESHVAKCLALISTAPAQYIREACAQLQFGTRISAHASAQRTPHETIEYLLMNFADRLLDDASAGELDDVSTGELDDASTGELDDPAD